MHDGDHATLHDARTYVEGLIDSTSLKEHVDA
jgi:hypothetical protein